MAYQPNLAQWHLVSYGYSTGHDFIYKYAIDTKYVSTGSLQKSKVM